MDVQQAFETIAKDLELHGVVKSQMFGMPVWKLNGKALGGPWQGSMVFKLDGPALAQALKLPGARQFDPMGGRPMKQWVVLGPEHQDKWPHYADEAFKLLADNA